MTHRLSFALALSLAFAACATSSPPPPPASSTASKDPPVPSDVSKNDVIASMRALNHGFAEQCYSRFEQKGLFPLVITVGPEGSAAHIEVRGEQNETARCLAEIAAHGKFPVSAQGSWTFTYPVMFR